MLLKLNPSVSIASLYSVNFSNFEPQQQPMEPPPPGGEQFHCFCTCLCLLFTSVLGIWSIPLSTGLISALPTRTVVTSYNVRYMRYKFPNWTDCILYFLPMFFLHSRYTLYTVRHRRPCFVQIFVCVCERVPCTRNRLEKNSQTCVEFVSLRPVARTSAKNKRTVYQTVF